MSATSLVPRLALATLVTAACARTSVPEGWLPEPAEAMSSAHGGWMELHYRAGEERRFATGELIAVDADSVWILGDSGAVTIATAHADSGRAWAYQPRSREIGLWTLGGTVSTISNGFFLVLTAPMWIIGGTIAGGKEIRAAQRRAPELAWAELAPYARFPQGVPAGVPLASLRKKDPIRSLDLEAP